MTLTRTETTDTSTSELEKVLDRASDAFRPFAALAPAERAHLLRRVADKLDDAVTELVQLAREESHLPEPRLTGELARTTGQLRFFAAVLEEGSWLDATIDTADAGALPVPRPDVRRIQVSLGPVLVFAASNFPFAFSVAGGDSASALAAGCPVVLKAHPGHPALSLRTAELVVEALREGGAPDGTFQIVFGLEAGRTAVTDARIKAAAFTGSIPAGRALFDLVASRSEPIPFYGELGSLNPVFVTPQAVAARGAEIARGYVASFTLGAGQFCTKPGLLFLPSGHGLLGELAEAAGAVSGVPMLNKHIAAGHRTTRDRLGSTPGVQVVVPGEDTDQGPTPTLLRTTADRLIAEPDSLLEECFGPTSMVVEYAHETQLQVAARVLGGNLTATIHAEPEETELATALLAELRERAGRLVWNAWPTGVAVTWAMHHGGPYPATTAPLHTSVGAAAIERFVRPVCFQDVPEPLLPPALHNRNNLGIPRRVNGAITTDDVSV